MGLPLPRYRLTLRDPHQPQMTTRPSHRSGGLTRREADVLQLIATDLTDRQIAATLGVSPKTASNHVANILRKLEVPTRAAAVALAVSEHLILTPSTTDTVPRTNERR